MATAIPTASEQAVGGEAFSQSNVAAAPRYKNHKTPSGTFVLRKPQKDGINKQNHGNAMLSRANGIRKTDTLSNQNKLILKCPLLKTAQPVF